ncbi:MAG: glycosyltransferase family 4 protein [Saprospiraceae bacterium]
MKNILFIIDNLGSGGAQNQLTMLACLLKSIGHNVEIFYYYPQSFYKYRLDKAHIKIHKMEKSTNYGLDVVYKLTKLLYKKDFDITISFLTTPNFYNVVSKLLNLGRGKTIVSYRSSTVISDLSFFGRLKYKIINILADFIVFNSLHEQKNWINFFPKLALKSCCIYNVVDLNLFYKRPSYIRKYNLLVIGSVGPDKNGLVIVNALSEIRKKFNVNLTWIGQKVYNSEIRRSYLEEMERAIISNEVSDYWHWKEPTKNVYDSYREFDALILASKVEGLPNVVCEAMSTGTPVIISNVLDHPILVQHGFNGYLFNPNDSINLAECVISLYSLPQLEYEKMGLNARKFSEVTFSSKDFLFKFQNILNFL